MQRPPNRPEPAGHDRLREWLTLEREPGEQLSHQERRSLDEHLAECAECRAERRELARLDHLLANDLVSVREGFRDDVLAALPAAGWEARSPRAWRVPLAVTLALLVAAVALVGVSSGAHPGAGVGGFAGVVAALGQMLVTGVLAASGLLWASWRGLGLALDASLSPASAIALIALVVSLDVLVLALVARRRRPAPEKVRSAGGAGDRSSGS